MVFPFPTIIGAFITESHYLEVPETWEEFLIVCEQLKKSDIIPIGLGNKNKWPGAAWLGYALIRLHGLDLYRDLLSKNLLPNDPRIVEVFTLLKTLIDKQYIQKDIEEFGWTDVSPSVLRKLTGMTLIGKFFIGHVPEDLRDDIGYFPFPIINAGIPTTEFTPLDLFVVPYYSNNSKLVNLFLSFVSSKHVQFNYNKTLKLLSPNKLVRLSTDDITQKSINTINNATNLVQFIDRDTSPKMAKELLELFDEFLQTGNVEQSVKRVNRLLVSPETP